MQFADTWWPQTLLRHNLPQLDGIIVFYSRWLSTEWPITHVDKWGCARSKSMKIDFWLTALELEVSGDLLEKLFTLEKMKLLVRTQNFIYVSSIMAEVSNSSGNSEGKIHSLHSEWNHRVIWFPIRDVWFFLRTHKNRRFRARISNNIWCLMLRFNLRLSKWTGWIPLGASSREPITRSSSPYHTCSNMSGLFVFCIIQGECGEQKSQRVTVLSTQWLNYGEASEFQNNGSTVTMVHPIGKIFANVRIQWKKVLRYHFERSLDVDFNHYQVRAVWICLAE